MTSRPGVSRRRIVFVAPRLAGEALRGARAVSQLENVTLLGVCEHLPDSSNTVFADVVLVDETHGSDQLIHTARSLIAKHGALERIVTVHETLLTAVAQANQELKLLGLSVSTVQRVLDKSLLKQTLHAVGLQTARDQVVCGNRDAHCFVEEVGLPVVIKPMGGSGGLATWRVRTDKQLESALQLLQPSRENPVLLEDYLDGQEFCIDTIAVADEPRFYSVCCYRPSILDALEDSTIQWTCVMPRDIETDAYRGIIEQGLEAVRSLAVGNTMTHMEGFMLKGGGVRFTDATLRPAGARIGPMLAFAYDMDPYRAWARVAVDRCFDGPWERRYAVGTVFLRGSGQGTVERVSGISKIRNRLGHLVVDSRLPAVGNVKSVTYTGDGYITVRHPETRVVEDALEMIARNLVIEYSEAGVPAVVGEETPEHWSQRLREFDQRLYQPVWDDDSLGRVEEA